MSPEEIGRCGCGCLRELSHGGSRFANTKWPQGTLHPEAAPGTQTEMTTKLQALARQLGGLKHHPPYTEEHHREPRNWTAEAAWRFPPKCERNGFAPQKGRLLLGFPEDPVKS